MTRIALALGGALAVVGCGGATAAPAAAPPSTTPTSSEVVAMESEPELSPELRAALTPRLRAYGSGWDLGAIERAFAIAVDEHPTEYVLTFTARGVSGLSAVKKLGKVDGFSGYGLAVPAGPALTPAQQADVDAIVRASKTLWLNRNHGFAPLDVSAGVVALVGAGTLETRWRDGQAVLYVRQGHDPLCVIAVDLQARSVTEVTWHDLPPVDWAMVPAEQVEFIDAALRRHGDFGVYGNVTAGLVNLHESSHFGLTRRADFFHLSVSPRDGHGHELSFRIDARTGVVSDMAAGHRAEPM